jgi:hypothetical protein
MTREEQIKEAARQRADQYDHPSKWSDTYYSFIDGAKWADQHPHWIPVEERLPEKDNEFEDYSKLVIVTNGKDFWKGMYNYGGAEWLTFDLWQIDDATHWMEFVPPRKEE